MLLPNSVGNWRCERASTLYDGIFCPEGYYKVPEIDFEERCDQVGKPCPEGYTCYCRPCIKAFEVSLFQYDPSLLENATNVESGCEKMSLCGDALEQGEEVVFRAYDNRQRRDVDVTALVHIGQNEMVVNGEPIEPYLYEFRFSTTRVGIVTLEVFFGDEQIPESPVRVEIVSRNCEVDFPGQGMVSVS